MIDFLSLTLRFVSNEYLILTLMDTIYSMIASRIHRNLRIHLRI